MKKIFFLFFMTAAITFLSCSNSNDSVTLKFSLPKGTGYDYNMDMIMTTKGNVSGQPMDVTNKMAMGYHFGVIKDSAGWKTLSATITRIAMNINANGVNVDFDSDKPTDTSSLQMVSKVLGAIKGGQFSFTMNDRGEVGNVYGVQAMMQRVLSSINMPDEPSVMSTMGTAFNEQNFRQNIQQSFAIYPDKPVKPGDSWSSKINMNTNDMPMDMANTYTLESITGNTAKIKVNTKVSSPATNANSNINIGGVMTGTMKYDIPTGVPLDGDLDMNMDMKMNTGGQSLPMNTDIKMKITGKKS